MQRRTLIAGAAALGLAPAPGRAGVVFWHAMNGTLNDEVNRICAGRRRTPPRSCRCSRAPTRKR